MAEDSSEIVREAAESVGFVNVKAVGEGPAFYSNLAMGNAVAYQQAMQAVIITLAGKVGESVIAVSPSEGGADVAALGQLMKGLYNTPPAGMSGVGGGAV